MKWTLLILLVVCGCHTEWPQREAGRARSVGGLERILVAPGGRGFVMADSGRPFHPWGLNYGNAGRLMEDFWDTDWNTLASDFKKMKSEGANVVRVHLQFGKFMRSPRELNRRAFRQFARLLRLAEATGLYLDVTGLACYRPADVPRWYDDLEEPERWTAQASFWEAIAQVGAGQPAVFCYDLINEPLSPGGPRQPGAWPSGSRFGGFDFLQFIALNPAGRKREDIPVQWIRRMTAAIRQRDRKALITVGLLPWSRDWKFLSGFVPEKIGPQLDFLSVHLYPDSKKPGEALESLRHFLVGKPVVIEETFPLSCSVAEEEQFLRASREFACGWMGHYDGHTVAEYDALDRARKVGPGPNLYREWLRLFVRLRPEFSPGPVARSG